MPGANGLVDHRPASQVFSKCAHTLLPLKIAYEHVLDAFQLHAALGRRVLRNLPGRDVLQLEARGSLRQWQERLYPDGFDPAEARPRGDLYDRRRARRRRADARDGEGE